MERMKVSLGSIEMQFTIQCTDFDSWLPQGVYAWITANYLLGKIGSGTKAHVDSTIAVMDLGGASTQIVFEPLFAQDSSVQMAEGDHKYHLNFGGRDFQLYQHSYLGYGLMRARRSVNNLVAFTWSFLQPGGDMSAIEWDEMEEQVEIPNPCFASGMSKRVLLDPPGRKQVNVTMIGTGGGYEACNRVVEMVMAKDA
jgi:guanosine-diphosphatase